MNPASGLKTMRAFLMAGLLSSGVVLGLPTAHAADTASDAQGAVTAGSPVDPQGYGWDGCNELGTWLSQWGSSTGTYYDWLNVQTYGSGFIGYYTNGNVTFYLDYYTSDGAPHYSGVWRRTSGSSGGPCQYGTAEFTLKYTGDYFGYYPSCSLGGHWNYCSLPPQLSWFWSNTQTFY